MLRRSESKPPLATLASLLASYSTLATRASLLSPPDTRPVLCLSPGCGRRKQRLEKMRLLDSGLLENVREDPRLAMVSPDTRQHMV